MVTTSFPGFGGKGDTSKLVDSPFLSLKPRKAVVTRKMNGKNYLATFLSSIRTCFNFNLCFMRIIFHKYPTQNLIESWNLSLLVSLYKHAGP